MIRKKAKAVVSWIKEHGSITTEEARTYLGINDLSSAVIPCLRRQMPIKSVWVDGKKPNGSPTKMCRYFIEDEKPVEAKEGAVKPDVRDLWNKMLAKAACWDKLMWQIDTFDLLVDADAFKMINGNKAMEYFVKLIEKIKKDGGIE